MKKSIVEQSRLPLLASLALTLLACADGGATEDAPASKSDGAAEVGELPAAALVADVQLSETHSVKFYDIGHGGGMVTESYNVDDDTGLTQLDEGRGVGSLAALYLSVAPDADPKVVSRLKAMDQERALAPEPEETESVGTNESDLPVQLDASSNKGFDSDIAWFSGNYCNGCLGQEGSRRGWEPSGFPMCYTAPEVCEAANQRLTYRKSARNFTAFAYNMSSSGSGNYLAYLEDPCQHDSWWSRTFSVCTKPAQVASVPIAARSVIRSITSAGASWRYAFEVTGPNNVAVSLDFY